MTDKEKINIILDLLTSDQNQDKINSPVHIGHLNKPQGILGMKTAEVGTPVFDTGDRYMIVLETIDGKKSHELYYYKDSLEKVIDKI